jgi:hypothetical protein
MDVKPSAPSLSSLLLALVSSADSQYNSTTIQSTSDNSALTVIARVPSTSAMSYQSMDNALSPSGDTKLGHRKSSMPAAGAKYRHRRADSGNSMDTSLAYDGNQIHVSLRQPIPSVNSSDEEHLEELSRLVEKNARLLSPPSSYKSDTKSTSVAPSKPTTIIASSCENNNNTANTTIEKAMQTTCNMPVGTGSILKHNYCLHPKSKSAYCLVKTTMPTNNELALKAIAPSSSKPSADTLLHDNTEDNLTKTASLSRAAMHISSQRKTHRKKLSDSYIIIQARREQQLKQQQQQLKQTRSKVRSIAYQFEKRSIGVAVTPPPSHKPLPPPNLPVRPKTQFEVISINPEEAKTLGKHNLLHWPNWLMDWYDHILI